MTWAAIIKLGPYIAIVILLAALGITRGTLDHVRMQAIADVAAAQVASAKHDLEQAGRTTAAVETYANKAVALQPIILRSTNEVTRYAETPAGRAPCLAADRLIGVQQDRAALFAIDPNSAGSGAATVPTDATSRPAGRIGNLR